jgi:hypothetical protein
MYLACALSASTSCALCDRPEQLRNALDANLVRVVVPNGNLDGAGARPRERPGDGGTRGPRDPPAPFDRCRLRVELEGQRSNRSPGVDSTKLRPDRGAERAARQDPECCEGLQSPRAAISRSGGRPTPPKREPTKTIGRPDHSISTATSPAPRPSSTRSASFAVAGSRTAAARSHQPSTATRSNGAPRAARSISTRVTP